VELRQAAHYFEKEKFSVYVRENDDWDLEEIEGRFLPVDRFLSNFSRPLHRRMFVCDVDTVIPPSGTVRSEATGEVYVIGQGRFDAYNNNPYQAMYMAHLVTGAAGGLATVTRRETEGPATDPGYLVETVLGKYYVDLEFKSSTNDTGTVQQTIGQYFLMCPPECPLDKWDSIHLNGRDYVVETSYFDSGMRFAKVENTNDNRVDLQYLKTTGFSYDSDLGESVDTTQSYNVSGTVHDYTKTSVDSDRGSENVFKVVIAANHIGFNPTPRESVIVDGVTHIILKVTRDPLTKEWTLVCQT